jgi:acetyl-CoA carboxylase biotin carboxylase subunit
MKHISKILIANRGEIAVRIVRACKRLGIASVVAVSEIDKGTLAARLADGAVCIGPSRSADSYLNINSLIVAALGTGADAVHPGYGFLAEQTQLVRACNEKDLIFIGPTEENIQQMGNKIVARKVAEECGVPTIPGSDKVASVEEALARAEEISFPVIIKAAAGGGGKGMKIAYHPSELRNSFETLSAEVSASFGDGSLYIEHFIPDARHIEVQILGDRRGKVIHFGERDCSVQRRYQKMIEEAPSPVVGSALRNAITEAAVAIGRNIGYQSAGTVEFVFDQSQQKFFFLEMNTRIQVEHPVTEEITGVDLVAEQIRIANGETIAISQEDIKTQGNAIECRINAEKPDAGFSPSPGRIQEWLPPSGRGIRVDTHCFSQYVVPPYYDSLIAKLIVKGADRDEAVELMRSALEKFMVKGIDTNISFHLLVLNHPDFRAAKVSTRWLEDKFLPEIRRGV